MFYFHKFCEKKLFYFNAQFINIKGYYHKL